MFELVNRKMKIAIYNTSISGGGAERFTVLLSNGLANRGYDIHLLTGALTDGEYVIDENVNRIVLHEQLNFLSNIKSLYQYLRKYHIDICIAVGIYPNLVAAAANCFPLKTRIVLCERNAPKEDHLSWKSKALRALLYWRGDAFVFQTPDARDFYSKSIQRRSIIIPNPIREGLPQRSLVHEKRIVAVGRLMPQKNYLLLLESFFFLFKENADYTLHIYGKGFLESGLRLYAEHLGIANRVFFEGFFLDVHERIKNSDIFVMSSDFEGMPNALMEAMAMGFPVISTNCPAGGPRMLIQNGVNGILVPVGDKETLANAMIYYMSNPNAKELLAQNAHKIYDMYSLSNILGKWIEFLKVEGCCF